MVNNIRVRLPILTIEKSIILLHPYFWTRMTKNERDFRKKGVTRKQDKYRIKKRESSKQNDLQKERTSQAVQTYSSDPNPN